MKVVLYSGEDDLCLQIAGKYFVVHVDVATLDGLVIRVSFSNLFKVRIQRSRCNLDQFSLRGQNRSIG